MSFRIFLLLGPLPALVCPSADTRAEEFSFESKLGLPWGKVATITAEILPQAKARYKLGSRAQFAEVKSINGKQINDVTILVSYLDLAGLELPDVGDTVQLEGMERVKLENFSKEMYQRVAEKVGHFGQAGKFGVYHWFVVFEVSK